MSHVLSLDFWRAGRSKRAFLFALKLGLFIWSYEQVRIFCKNKTEGFTLLEISSNRPYTPQWDGHALSQAESEEVDAALSQKYHYLASGNQAFAFLSEDGTYVLKFFRHSLYKLPLSSRFIPEKWNSKIAAKREKKWDKQLRDFSSYLIAFDELKNETGALLVHLNKTENIQKKVRVVDKLNIEHLLDIDEFDFVLQKKGELVFPTLEGLIGNGELSKAKLALSSLAQLLVAPYLQGIGDSEPDLDKNYGFIGSKAIEFDIGRFYRTNNTSQLRPPVIKQNFKEWLTALNPELYCYFEAEVTRLTKESL